MTWFAASLLGGCAVEQGFVDPPGAVEVPSLAGCTWTTETSEVGVVPPSAQSWTYDDDGRLQEYVRMFDDELGDVTTYAWRGQCLAEVRTDLLGARYAMGDGPPVDWCTCDRHGNPVSCEHGPIDSGDVVPDARTTFVNAYDSLGQLSDVVVYDAERLARGAPHEVALLATEAWTYGGDGHPVQVHREEPGPMVTSTTTTTWLWDHDLLLQTIMEGTGTDVTIARHFEGRRLVKSIELHDDVPIVSTTWTYLDDGDLFPFGESVVDARYGVATDARVTVSCR